MTIEWILPARERATDYSFAAKINTYKNKQTCIILSESTMKKARLYIGDRVQIGIDDQFICLKRSSKTGYSIGVAGGNKGQTEKHKNTHKRSSIKLTSNRLQKVGEVIFQDSDIIYDDPEFTLVLCLQSS